jgi:hypothetical protein
MTISKIKSKQEEKLKQKSLLDKMKASARLAAAEMRATKGTKEPEQLASGKSDKHGNMTWEKDPHDED